MCHKKVLKRGGVVRTDGPSREGQPANHTGKTPAEKGGGNAHTLGRRYDRNLFQKKMSTEARERRLAALVRSRARR